MNISNLSGKNRTLYRWTSFIAAGLLAASVAGCGGGGGSDAAAPAPGGVVAAPAGTPVGTAVVTAAAATPATTNTADNPAQAFGLIQTVGAAPVTIQSPPVVNFTVIDSTGKFVPGLTLVNLAGSAAGLAADPNCSGSNIVGFTIAKLNQPADTSPSTWQSLISRQRYATSTTGKNAVVEATTDPKPTATGTTTVTKADGTVLTKQTYANPSTAVADPSTRIVGILEENTTGGYYTYRFATDVVTPLLMADAVDVKNVSLGRLANNGNVAVKDGKTVHRVGLQLCYTDPATKAKVTVNPYYDFTLGADGVAVPVKDSTGALVAAKKVVDQASCYECHAGPLAHGSRVDPNFCVTCHNPGTSDFQSGNLIDFKIMIHKLHMGKDLTKDWSVRALVAKATDASGNVTGIGFPQNVKNCVKCHTGTAAAAGSASGTHATANGDNWKTVPSRAACGACHDGIDFAKNTGLNLGDALVGKTSSSIAHIGGAKADDTQCALCHGTAEIPAYHVTVTQAPTTTGLVGAQSASLKSLPSGAAKIAYEISSVTVAGTPKRATVVFRILKDGAPVTFNTFATGGTVLMTGFTGGPTIYLGYAVPQDLTSAPADFNVSASSSVQNLWDGSKGTLSAPDANGFYTAVFGNATADGFDIPANAVMVTAFMGYAVFTQTAGLDTNAYPNGLRLVAQDVQKTATGYTARRAIVANAKCNACHEQLGLFTSSNFHSGYRNDASACTLCHTPNRTSNGWNADSTVFIHAIHGNSKRTVPYTWAAASTTDSFAEVGYPGILKNCETCHVAGSYDFSATANAAAVPNRLFRTVATGVFNKSTSLTKAPTFDANGVANSGGSTSLTAPTAAAAALAAFRMSPYVVADNATDYGIGFSYTAYRAAAAAKAATATTMALPAVATETDVTRQAATTTLVNSPIAAACFSCHDSSAAQTHMNSDGGGSIYQTRAIALAKTENCLFCHGAGKLVDIKAMHAK